jgi:putative FmdB family regulatory protein
MPTYEYTCKECNKKFTQFMTISEHDKNKVACPKCKSKKVEQKPAAFFAVSAKKS